MALIDHLILNENAYFYKTVEGYSLSKTKIDRIFTEVSSERVGNYTLKKVKQVEALGTYSVYYSICIFKFDRSPTFLDEDISEIVETKYAYLLLVEYSNFIVVIRKNISNLKLLNDSIEPLDYFTISRVYVNQETRFEKLSMKNMDIANTAIRNKIIEANNVKDSISNLGANKYIVQNMRVSDNEGTKSLSLNTSRISDIDKKVHIRELLNWIVSVVNKANTFAGAPSFLDVFATPIDFESNITTITPASILFSFSEVKSDLELGRVTRIKYLIEDHSRDVSIQMFLSFLNGFNNFCEINRDEDEDVYKIVNSYDSSLELNVNAKSITVGSKKLKNLILEFDGTESNLIEYLNHKHSFLVTFDRVELIYFSRRLFQDNKLLTGITGFFSAFISNHALQTTTSEKGDIDAHTVSFQNQSVFSVIENDLCSGSTYLFCDDLGNEWADYIALDDSSISFFHAKSNNGAGVGLSASKFQDIVGQALKNLGNIVAVGHQLDSKVGKWTQFYSDSQILRLRVGDTVENGIEFYKRLSTKPNIRKRVYLTVDFISRQDLVTQLTRLINGENVTRRNELVQILWFISSLISQCTELGFEVYIVCCP